MIKSELVQIIANRNPHLFLRDVENIVNAIFDEITEALANRLIDELGGEEEAIAWLGTKGVNAKLEVIEWKPRDSGSGFPLLGNALVRQVARLLGYPEESGDIIRQLGMERLFLDGLLSVWQPEKSALGD